MPRDPGPARAAILEATIRLLRRGGGATVELVAREARCAKGLVHYHFRTKGALLAAVAAQLGQERRVTWTEAFRASTPAAAIERSWQLLASEGRKGTLRAWITLYAQRERVVQLAVSEEVAGFGRALAGAARALLTELRLTPSVPIEEIGLLLAAVVDGTGLQLEANAPADRVHGAYAAAWLGVLSLARPAAD